MAPAAFDPADPDMNVEDPTLTAGDPREDIEAVVDNASDKHVSVDEQAQFYQQALDYFLADKNDVRKRRPTDKIEVVRYDEETGTWAVAFTGRVQALTQPEIELAQERATKKSTQGPNGEEIVDEFRFHTLLIVQALIVPNLRDDQILAIHKTPENAVRSMFQSGERVNMGNFIMALSGFGKSVSSAAKRVTKEVDAAGN